MNIKNTFTVVLLVCVISGCAWLPFGRSSSAPATKTPRISAQVIDPGLLAEGGTMVFIPFTAGPAAAAGPALDRMALMIVKGASDELVAANAPLRIVTGEDGEPVDFVLEGRIEEFTDAFGWKGLGYGRKKITLRVKGELRERKTGAVVALIFGSQVFKHAKEIDQTAYQVGRGIAEELLQ